VRYAVYLLYWHKGTNSDAAGEQETEARRQLAVVRASWEEQAAGAARAGAAHALALDALREGAQFACFTGTKVEILTQRMLLRWMPSAKVLGLLALMVQRYKY
jgi:hypothetical protein